MKSKILIVLTVFCLLFAACSPKCDVYCSDPLTFKEAGYDTSQIKTIIVNGYMPGNNFTQLVFTDTLKYTYYGPTDTFMFYDRGFLAEQDTVYDWQIYLPAINRTYKVTGIEYTGDINQNMRSERPEQDCIDFRATYFCSRTMTSYNVDGNTYSGKTILLQK